MNITSKASILHGPMALPCVAMLPQLEFASITGIVLYSWGGEVGRHNVVVRVVQGSGYGM